MRYRIAKVNLLFGYREIQDDCEVMIFKENHCEKHTALLWFLSSSLKYAIFKSLVERNVSNNKLNFWFLQMKDFVT